MAISKGEYDEQLDFLLRLNRDSVTTRMHMGYGGAVETAFERLLADAPPKKTRGTDKELWACVSKAKEAWFVRGVDLPFITTPIRQQATQSIETFLNLARRNLSDKF
ncbi:hypothetical protein [Candidatus Entotheonella palauensis]|uniref:hypothetical protein n=1 Tax=Candidatus Entotheonella palauensis TaxID=93172 RepID=UPI000B7F546A|nr:hypothetical protein [Candidatus Entotheonella palauensis]